MYQEWHWIKGWLWYRTIPNGKLHRASVEETIAALHERIVQLETGGN